MHHFFQEMTVFHRDSLPKIGEHLIAGYNFVNNKLKVDKRIPGYLEENIHTEVCNHK